MVPIEICLNFDPGASGGAQRVVTWHWVVPQWLIPQIHDTLTLRYTASGVEGLVKATVLQRSIASRVTNLKLANPEDVTTRLHIRLLTALPNNWAPVHQRGRSKHATESSQSEP